MLPQWNKHRPIGNLRVLTYHRVAEPSHAPLLNVRLISATPKVFARQIRYLAENYNVVSMERVLASVVGGKSLPKRAVLITFDDAYIDFADFAWPVLRSYRFPVTLFVPTAYAARTLKAFWWDRLHAALVRTSRNRIQVQGLGELVIVDNKERVRSLTKLQDHIKTLNHADALKLVDALCADLDNHLDCQSSTLNWEQLRSLSRQGVTLGAHTRTHPLLTKIPLDQARWEVSGSCEDLRKEIGEVLPVFAYPSGDHNDAVIGILKEEGIRIAVTTLHGLNDMNTADPLRLHRINITQRTTPTIFRFRLLQVFSWIEQFRH